MIKESVQGKPPRRSLQHGDVVRGCRRCSEFDLLELLKADDGASQPVLDLQRLIRLYSERLR